MRRERTQRIARNTINKARNKKEREPNEETEKQ